MDLGHASRLIHGRAEPLVGSEHRRASSYPQAAIDASPVKVCANSQLHSTDWWSFGCQYHLHRLHLPLHNLKVQVVRGFASWSQHVCSHIQHICLADNEHGMSFVLDICRRPCSGWRGARPAWGPPAGPPAWACRRAVPPPRGAPDALMWRTWRTVLSLGQRHRHAEPWAMSPQDTMLRQTPPLKAYWQRSYELQECASLEA